MKYEVEIYLAPTKDSIYKKMYYNTFSAKPFEARWLDEQLWFMLRDTDYRYVVCELDNNEAR